MSPYTSVPYVVYCYQTTCMKLLGLLNVEYSTVLLDNLSHHQVDQTSNDCKVLPSQ